MSYEPTNWKAGDTITSAKLNKIEQGIGGAVSFIHAIKVEVEVEDTIASNNDNINQEAVLSESPSYYYKLDKTYEEISAAMQQGLVVCLFDQSNNEYLATSIGICGGYMASQSEGYGIFIFDLASGIDRWFISESNNGELIEEGAALLPDQPPIDDQSGNSGVK